MFDIIGSGDYDGARIAHREAKRPVAIGVKTNLYSGGNLHAFVDNCVPHTGTAPNVYPFEED